MFCENCGNQIPDDSEFCEHCGTRIEPGAPENAQDNIPAPHPVYQPPYGNPPPVSPQPANYHGGQQTHYQKKAPAGLIIGIIAAVVVIGVGGFFGIKALNDKNNPTPGASVPSTVSDSTVSPEIPENTPTAQTPAPKPEASERPIETPAPVPETYTLWGGYFSDSQWRKALETDDAIYMKQYDSVRDTATSLTGLTPLDIADVDLTGVWIMRCGIAHSAGDNTIADITTRHTIRKTGGGYVSDVELLAAVVREEGAYADNFLSGYSPKATITADDEGSPFFTFDDAGGMLTFYLFDVGGVSLIGAAKGDDMEGAFFLSFWRVGD